MTDVLPEKLKEKLNIMQGNIGRTSSAYIPSDRKPVPRSTSNQQSKMMGIRISNLDPKPRQTNISISLKQLGKQEKIIFTDKIKPTPRISIESQFKQQPKISPLKNDLTNKVLLLKISKKFGISDQLMTNFWQNSTNNYLLKQQLKSVREKNTFSHDLSKDYQDLNQIQLSQKTIFTDIQMKIAKSSPKKQLFSERECSLKDLIKGNLSQKSHLKSDVNNHASTLELPYQLMQYKEEDQYLSIQTPRCEQLKRFTVQLNNSNNNSTSNSVKISESSFPSDICDFSQTIQPTKLISQNNEKKQIIQLEKQTKIDRTSRLGILLSTVKLETEKQIFQANTPIKLVFDLSMKKQIQQDISNEQNLLIINQKTVIFSDVILNNYQIQSTNNQSRYQYLKASKECFQNKTPVISQSSLKVEENKQILIIKPKKVKILQESIFMQQLEPQNFTDKSSRLGILISPQKIQEKHQINKINQPTIQNIKLQKLVKDIGQGKPNKLQFTSELICMANSVLFESKDSTKINLIKILNLQGDEESKTNELGLVFNSKILNIEQEVFQNKSIDVSYFHRCQKLSEDYSHQQNQIIFTETSYMDLPQPQIYRVQPKINLQHENNLERNRKKIEEIKQLISTSKKTNPLVLMTYNKQLQVKEQKLQIEIPKPIRNLSVRSNDGRQSATGQTTPIRNSSNEKQPSYMQMSKNNKSALNRFKKIKYLGRGNISDVYSVIDTTTGMIAALKTIQKSLITSKGIQGLVKTEIAIQSFINHPNILKCFGVINDDKQIALVLELGEITLYNFRKEKKLSEKQIIDIIYQVLKGVGFLHQNGIIHRDIKPENILLQGGVVKLADLGICIKATQSQQYCGTPGFIAPEIANNQIYDFKVDCYSIGVLLHELIFGKMPKQGQKIYGDTQLIRLMNGLLEVNPQKRMSCQQALEFDLFKLCQRKLQKQTEMIKNTILWDF